MSYGMKVYDKNAKEVFSTENNSVRILKHTVGRCNEVIYSDLFLTQTPFYFVTPKGRVQVSDISVTFSGNKCTIINTQRESPLPSPAYGWIKVYSIFVGVY
jgi:hypothetical protein